jgi:hypothetical protein
VPPTSLTPLMTAHHDRVDGACFDDTLRAAIQFLVVARPTRVVGGSCRHISQNDEFSN